MAPRREGRGETSQLLEYQTDVRRGRFDRPRGDSQCGFQGSALGNEEKTRRISVAEEPSKPQERESQASKKLEKTVKSV